MASSNVEIQTSPQSVPSTPPWLGEVAIIAHYLTHLGLLEKLANRVRFVRCRFGTYDVIDFVAVLIGYALSGEPTLETFYERLLPFAIPFMAVFGRNKLPSRSALSRFLKAMDQPPVEALRLLFEEDLMCRPLTAEGEQQTGLRDRCGECWEVFDADGTRQAARQRALPQTEELPAAFRRFDEVCAPGYLGRQRGEVLRTRTTLLLAHTHQWFGTFAGSGNGDYRGALLRVTQTMLRALKRWSVPLDHAILRLDGQYGDFAVIVDLCRSGLCYVTRGKDYGLLDLPQVQARLAQLPDQETTHPETGTSRALFDCPDLPVTGTPFRTRVIVATHPATTTAAPVGVTRDGIVYELFFTALPQVAFTPADVLALYLHRGAFETTLSDEDKEQDPDRWCSRTAWGQEFWQILSQWMWNVRLELGHHLSPTPMRITTFAPAQLFSAPVAQEPAKPMAYGPPKLARAAQMGGIPGDTFKPQADGTLHCPMDKPLYAQERRAERDGSVRVVYAARIAHCRPCPRRVQCLGYGTATKKPRRVSAVLWPLEGSPASPGVSPPPSPALSPLLWADWKRCHPRRALMRLLRTQTVTISSLSTASPTNMKEDLPFTRGQRAHYRLSWAERLARNASPQQASMLQLHLLGIPTAFATFLGLPHAS
jgi:hypothetical protein